jgi:hypothetical protein
MHGPIDPWISGLDSSTFTFISFTGTGKKGTKMAFDKPAHVSIYLASTEILLYKLWEGKGK